MSNCIIIPFLTIAWLKKHIDEGVYVVEGDLPDSIIDVEKWISVDPEPKEEV